jgi:phenylpropionate dioxygenase-like ring-hydroxylating dioxygenase large terminal subunit
MPVLNRTRASLPSSWYYDAEHYARELEVVWYRDWVCVGRAEEIARPGDYRLAEIGNQRLILTRDDSGQLQVFHNTCRHRGSTLCTAACGRFANSRIICPYHTWTYSLAGRLLDTPGRIEIDDFRTADYSLYAVHCDTWGGFLFVNLSDRPAEPLAAFLGDEAAALEHWPLSGMVSVHRETRSVACNWKVFWENYSECYHCPRLHPELCRVVPVYKKGVLSYADLPDWQPQGANDDGRPRVGPGLATWTLNGQLALPQIAGPDEAEREAGMAFASFAASLFVVAHPDYVRSVRVLPRGPESVQLVVDWLLMPEVMETHSGQLEHMLKLGRLVVEQDGRACELNQQGLKSRRHEHGVLVPQEHGLWQFHEWLRARLAQS